MLKYSINLKFFMEKSKGKLYWAINRFGNDFLVYYVGILPISGEISVKHFSELGPYASYGVNAKDLIPFNPERDMGKLRPKVVERVKRELEEIVN